MSRRNDTLSRAEQVRARRQMESMRQTPVSNYQERAARNAMNSSRVVARRPLHAPIPPASSSRQARKRVYVATGPEGTELRLPALPAFKPGWRLISGLLALAAGGALLFMAMSSTLRIANVNLAGAQRVGAAEIIQSLNVGGLPIVELVPAEVEKSILATFAEIGSASVSVTLPNQINVEVEERQPVIAWMREEQVVLWIDANGYAFTPRGDSTGLLAVHSTGEPPHPLGYVEPGSVTFVNPEVEESAPIKPSVDAAFVSAVQALSTILPEGTNLLHEPDTGLGWNDPNGWQVYFGNDTEHIDEKLVEYQTIVDTILAQNLHPVMISMEFLHAPYYRVEQ